MAIDIVTLALARKYTKDSANALGAVKGASCTIDSIVDTGEANVITFGWTGTDGTHQTSTMTAKHGAGVADLKIDDAGMLICTLTDGTVINAGQIPLGNSNCCDPDACTCISNIVATDEDADSLLYDMGLLDDATVEFPDDGLPYVSDDEYESGK